MDEAEAFRILGLPITATVEEINDRRAELASEVHSDTNPEFRGNDEPMQQINAAADLAVKFARNRQVMIPASALDQYTKTMVTSQEETRALVARAAYRDENEDRLKQIIYLRTHEAHSMRNASIGAAAIGAASGFLSQMMDFSVFSKSFGLDSGSDTGRSDIISVALFLLAGGAALVAWVSNHTMERIEQQIEELDGFMSNKSHYLEIIDGLAAHLSPDGPWTKATIEDGVLEWMESQSDISKSSLHSSAFRRRTLFRAVDLIGTDDFVDLLIGKGLELGVLEESVSRTDGAHKVEYSVRSLAPA